MKPSKLETSLTWVAVAVALGYLVYVFYQYYKP